MKKIITISTLFAGSAMLAFAATPSCPNSPITEIVSCSQKGGADSAKKIMEIQARENLDVSKNTFLIYQLAYCKGASEVIINAAKDGNVYAMQALKMMRIADAEDTLLELAKSDDTTTRKNAIDALTTCGASKSLDFFIADMPSTSPSNLGDYVKVSTELYRALPEDKKAEYKAMIQEKANSADGKIKVAYERILVEPKVEETPTKGKTKKKKS